MKTFVAVDRTCEVKIDSMAKVSVGGDLENKGSLEVKGRGELDVARNLLNEGRLIIDDPITLKEIVIEGIKTTQTGAELGKLKIIQL